MKKVIQKKRNRDMLVGVTSLADLVPSASYADYMPQRPAKERLRGYWIATGQYIKRAEEKFAEDNIDSGIAVSKAETPEGQAFVGS